MVKSPQVIPFIPLIAAGIGGATSLYSGYKADQRNQQALGQANAATAAQQALIQNLMAGINPQAYQQQAQVQTQDALAQLSSNFAQRGMLNSGALTTAGMQAASRAQADAAARYQQDRLSAYSMALGGQQAVGQQYRQNINPDPYAGLGQSLGAIGTAGANFLANRYGAATPGATGAGLPGFGVSYRNP